MIKYLSMVKTIIFDFDGTMGDSFKVALEIAHQLTGKSELIDEKEVAKLRTLSLFKAASELRIPKRIWPILLIKGRKMMADRLIEVKLFPGVEQLIEKLYKSNFQLYIVSSNSKSSITKILDHYNILSYFKNIYGGIGLLGKAKTLRFIMKQKNINKDMLLYIGDETRDITAAKKNHIKSIAVSWGYMSRDLLLAQEPWAIVDSVKELYEIIAKWDQAT